MELSINDLKQILCEKDCNTSGEVSGTVNHGLQIVILDRGFVYVGETTTDANWCVIKNAKNIRRWGTTKGLGELASEGPKTETKLDDAGTVRAPMRALIGLLACERSKWNGR